MWRLLFSGRKNGSSVFLPSIALNVVTGIDIFLCIGIMGLCSILYTMTGESRLSYGLMPYRSLYFLEELFFAVGYITMSIPGGFAEEAILISAADGKFSLGSTGFDLQDSTMWTVLIAAFSQILRLTAPIRVWCRDI